MRKDVDGVVGWRTSLEDEECLNVGWQREKPWGGVGPGGCEAEPKLLEDSSGS